MKNIKPTLVLSCICMAVALILSAVNMITGPIIEANRNASANEALLVVLPEGESFEEIDLATAGLPAIVTKAYQETTGKGFVFQMNSTGYQPGLVIMCGVDAEGKITGVTHLETKETYGKEAELNGVYIGQSLESFSAHIISGATKSSIGYSDAVSAALQSFVLVSGGELDPSFALLDMIPSLAPGFGTTEEVEAAGNIYKAFKSVSDTGFAYIVKDGEATYLILTNAYAACKVYDSEGKEVTANVSEAILADALAHASANQVKYTDKLNTNITNFNAGAAEITPVASDKFDTIVAGASFKADGADYYAFIARPFGYDQMNILIILDEGGAIVKLDCTTGIFFGHGVEYMPFYNQYKENEYESGFIGQTGTAGDNYLMSGATMTSDAVKIAINDVFAAYNSIKGGN